MIDDSVGRKFFDLTVISVLNKTKWGWRVECLCICGKTHSVLWWNLRSGQVKSCGCRRIKTTGTMSRTHGLSGKVPEYAIWKSMNQRCSDSSSTAWKWYGKIGIKVCNSWKKSFENFYRDMGTRPTPKHSIERINNSLGYSPENTKWVTRKEQMRNMRSNVIVKHRGRNLCLSAIAEMEGIPYKRFHQRYRRRGWSLEDSLSK